MFEIHRIIRFLWTAVLCAVLSCGTLSYAQEPELKEYSWYLLDSTETKLSTGSFTAESSDTDFLLQELVKRLNRTDDVLSSDHQMFPEGVRINSFELLDGTLSISLSEGYLKMEPEREILVRAGLVKTFVQVPDVHHVRLYAGDQELLDSRGNPVGAMNADSFVELFTADRDSYRYDTFTLYFTDKEGKHLIPEARTIYYRRSIPKARVALEQLAKGPIDKGNYPTIPESTTLLSVIQADNICYVDFDSVFSDLAIPGLDPEISVASVTNTVLSAVGGNKVQITVSGKNDIQLGEDLDLYQFFKWNQEMIMTEEAKEE